jgi:hypothetical protein
LSKNFHNLSQVRKPWLFFLGLLHLSFKRHALWVRKGVGKSHGGTLKLKSGLVELNGERLVGGEFVIDMNSCSD